MSGLLADQAFASAAIGAAGQPLPLNDPANNTAPVVCCTAPLDNAELSLRTLVRGEVQSGALATWQLLAAPAGTAPDDLARWTQLASGSQNLQGELGAFDPTLLPNGLWHLQLVASDLSQRQSRSRITVEVVGGAKPGLFMDASFKQNRFSPGLDLEQLVPFGSQAFLDAAKEGATVNEQEGWVQHLNQSKGQEQLNTYQAKLKATIDASKPNASVGDVLGIIAADPDRLPLNQPSVGIIERISRPSKLFCAGLSSPLIKNRLELEVHHAFGLSAPEEELVGIPSEELKGIQRWHNGIRLFEASLYEGEESSWGIWFLSAKDCHTYRGQFLERVAENRKTCGDEWATWNAPDNVDIAAWIEGLFPFALLGDTGDFLALDTYHAQGRIAPEILFLSLDVYTGGPFDETFCDWRWGSIAEFLKWYELDLTARLNASNWRFTDASGEQYVVEQLTFKT